MALYAGWRYSTGNAARLTRRSLCIKIGYAVPRSFLSDGVHFRMRLIGVDAEWQNAGSNHIATYTTLSLQRRHFEVQAGSENVVSHRIRECIGFVKPAFHQNTWLLVLAPICGIVFTWFVYRNRVRAVTTEVRDLMAERLLERERIAAERHDSLLQSVQGLILLFSGVAAQLPADSRIADITEAAIQRAELLLEEGRDSVRDLRTKAIDLAECFNDLRQEFEGSPVEYSFLHSGQQPDLQPTVGDEVYKLGREAVRNVSHHAEASHIRVQLAFLPYALQLVVHVDGIDMKGRTLWDGETAHWGLQEMTARAHNLRGQLRVQSKSDYGTTVRLTVAASMAYRNGTPTLRSLLKSFSQRLRAKLRPVDKR